MRVVGGVAKGRKLRGATVSGVRPTSERVRGAIFNILGALDLRPTRVLDLYAGSGSLGIEALSRGASRADFVEHHQRQCAAIRENLAVTGFTQQATVYCTEVAKALGTLTDRYHLILMDPPYKLADLDEILETLVKGGLLEEEGILVVGHSKRRSLRSNYDDVALTGSYRYGDSTVDCFEKVSR